MTNYDIISVYKTFNLTERHMKEFFGFGGYQRTPEGAYSWQHLLFVSIMLGIMLTLAITLGLYYRKKSDKLKNNVLVWAAILIDVFEIFKIIMGCVVSGDPMHWTVNLPLFLCSIQLITLPLAAFSKGRLKEASLDFVLIFGILGGVLGTVGAAQNYNAYPVLSFDNMVSATTHCISAFASIYIAISGMTSLKKKNIPITLAILGGFCGAALLANQILDYNYMFLRRGDGTPYDILYNIVGGNAVLYPICVILLFVIYIAIFYSVYYLCNRSRSTAGSN